MGQLTSKQFQCKCLTSEAALCNSFHVEYTTGIRATDTDEKDDVSIEEVKFEGVRKGPNFRNEEQPRKVSMNSLGSIESQDSFYAYLRSGELLRGLDVHPAACSLETCYSNDADAEVLSSFVHEVPSDTICKMHSRVFTGQPLQLSACSLLPKHHEAPEVTQRESVSTPLACESDSEITTIDSSSTVGIPEISTPRTLEQDRDCDSLEFDGTAIGKDIESGVTQFSDPLSASGKVEKSLLKCFQHNDAPVSQFDFVAEDAPLCLEEGTAVEIGDIVILDQGVPREYCNRAAIVTNVADSHCTVVVLDETGRYGVGECWPSYENISFDCRNLRLGARVIVSGMCNARTKHLNGKVGVISKHPRQGHPCFIKKASCADPQLSVCVTFEGMPAKDRSVLLEPRFLTTWQEASMEAARSLTEAAVLLLNAQRNEKLEGA